MNSNNRKTRRGVYLDAGDGKDSLAPPPPPISGANVFRHIMCSYNLPIMIVTAYT